MLHVRVDRWEIGLSNALDSSRGSARVGSPLQPSNEHGAEQGAGTPSVRVLPPPESKHDLIAPSHRARWLSPPVFPSHHHILSRNGARREKSQSSICTRPSIFRATALQVSLASRRICVRYGRLALLLLPFDRSGWFFERRLARPRHQRRSLDACGRHQCLIPSKQHRSASAFRSHVK